MARGFAVLFTLLAFGCGSLVQAENAAQSVPPIVFEPWKSCPGDTDDHRAWLTTRNPPLDGEKSAVPTGDVFEVPDDQKEVAVSLLAQREAVELSRSQAAEMTDGQAKGREGKKPYLIRNVVPGFLSALEAGPARMDRIGAGIRISAGLFGCGGFGKYPLVVYLPSAPSQIDMRVSAIW